LGGALGFTLDVWMTFCYYASRLCHFHVR